MNPSISDFDHQSPEEIRKQFPHFAAMVREAKFTIIGTHVNPDGDAIGAAVAVSHALDQLGAPHAILCQHEAPHYLKFLPGADRVKTELDPAIEPDLAIICDLDALDRLGKVRPRFESVDKTIVIDHHIPIESPGDMRIISVRAPAACAILTDLFLDSEVQITPEMANCLLAGILTDTGSFRYPNTTAHSLQLAAQLLEAGASISHVSEEVYMRKSLPAVRILGRAIERAKITPDGKVTWVTLPNEVFAELEATDQDSEGIVNEMLAIRTVEVAAILRETTPGKIRGSLRSRSHIDVAQVAREFGGGGHRNAAGVSFDGSLQEAEIRLVEALRRCVE